MTYTPQSNFYDGTTPFWLPYTIHTAHSCSVLALIPEDSLTEQKGLPGIFDWQHCKECKKLEALSQVEIHQGY
jgi:hypothetical protein